MSNTDPKWTKDQLYEVLNTAVAVEMFTIPVYLSAATSIKEENRKDKLIATTLPDGDNNTKPESFSAYNVIMSVAVQEMFHLTMACNLANAVGLKPDLTPPDLDNPPSCLSGIAGMKVKGNLTELIDTMLAIEAPDPNYHYPETPTDNDPTHFKGPKGYQASYKSIGDLYHALAYGIRDLWDDLYSPDYDDYQKTSFSNKYQDVTAIIKTKEDAYNVIACIVEQGEGNGADGFMPDGYIPTEDSAMFHDLDEISHWERFHDIKTFMDNGGVIPQYKKDETIEHIIEEIEPWYNLTRTYSLLMEQLEGDFKAKKSDVNLRGMAETGNYATALWKVGGVPQWGTFKNPEPWPVIKFPHSCQGLNECKGQGYQGSGTEAGNGSCATAATHTCQYSNVCKYQGGCGYAGKSDTGAEAFDPRENSCAGKGGCMSPISPDQYYNQSSTVNPHAGKAVWDVARALFKARYEKENPGKKLAECGPVSERRKKVKPNSPKSS